MTKPSSTQTETSEAKPAETKAKPLSSEDMLAMWKVVDRKPPAMVRKREKKEPLYRAIIRQAVETGALVELPAAIPDDLAKRIGNRLRIDAKALGVKIRFMPDHDRNERTAEQRPAGVRFWCWHVVSEVVAGS